MTIRASTLLVGSAIGVALINGAKAAVLPNNNLPQLYTNSNRQELKSLTWDTHASTLNNEYAPAHDSKNLNTKLSQGCRFLQQSNFLSQNLNSLMRCGDYSCKDRDLGSSSKKPCTLEEWNQKSSCSERRKNMTLTPCTEAEIKQRKRELIIFGSVVASIVGGFGILACGSYALAV